MLDDSIAHPHFHEVLTKASQLLSEYFKIARFIVDPIVD